MGCFRGEKDVQHRLPGRAVGHPGALELHLHRLPRHQLLLPNTASLHGSSRAELEVQQRSACYWNDLPHTRHRLRRNYQVRRESWARHKYLHFFPLSLQPSLVVFG